MSKISVNMTWLYRPAFSDATWSPWHYLFNDLKRDIVCPNTNIRHWKTFTTATGTTPSLQQQHHTATSHHLPCIVPVPPQPQTNSSLKHKHHQPAAPSSPSCSTISDPKSATRRASCPWLNPFLCISRVEYHSEVHVLIGWKDKHMLLSFNQVKIKHQFRPKIHNETEDCREKLRQCGLFVSAVIRQAGKVAVRVRKQLFGLWIELSCSHKKFNRGIPPLWMSEEGESLNSLYRERQGRECPFSRAYTVNLIFVNFNR